MLNVIINEGLYDKEFVEKWTFGFEELKERVQQYPPGKVAEITWVPEDQIVAAARLYATSKPAAIHWGVPIDMNPQGTTVAQAITHLWCVTGNVDMPGGDGHRPARPTASPPILTPRKSCWISMARIWSRRSTKNASALTNTRW